MGFFFRPELQGGVIRPKFELLPEGGHPTQILQTGPQQVSRNIEKTYLGFAICRVEKQPGE